MGEVSNGMFVGRNGVSHPLPVLPAQIQSHMEKGEHGMDSHAGLPEIQAIF